jgi:glycosyltransferase involved in cell wall biosynthesis
VTPVDSPRFSVVIPSYNSALTLRETLESLAAQTDKDFEVVVVDDGSTDGSLEVARTELERLALRGRVIARPTSVEKGVAGCRNVGLGVSRGEWVAFLDSDDLFAPAKLGRMAEVISAGERRAFRAICHPSARFADESREDLGDVGRLVPGGPRPLLDKLLREGNSFATCGIVIERSLLEEIGGFDQSLHGVEDWWLVIRVSARTDWAYVDEPLASIRMRARSLMQGRSFSGYARQYALLLRAARRSSDLSARQVAELSAYMRTGAGRHYASKAAARGEWGQVLSGSVAFARAGFPGVGASILGVQLWRATLHVASRVARALRRTGTGLSPDGAQ